MTLIFWALVILNVILFLALVSNASFLSWFPRMVAVTFGWSIAWAIAAWAHNQFVSSDEFWQISNFAFDLLWDILGFVKEVWLWPGWHGPTTNADMAHLAVIIFSTLAWSPESNPQKPTEHPEFPPSASLGDSHEPSQAESMSSNLPIDYRQLVDPESVRSVAVSVASRYPHSNQGDLLRAAALFEYVKENVTYVRDPIHMQGGETIQGDIVAAPSETLDLRGGDCDDQAILMASLLSAIGIANRIRLISNSADEWHLITEFCVELNDSSEIATLLDDFYHNSSRQTRPRTYWFFAEDGKFWLLADTTRDYVPDYDGLLEDGYLVKTEEGGLIWVNCPSIH